MFVAVDTNVVLLLAAEDADTIDAWDIIRRRIQTAQFLVPPTVFLELVFKSRQGEDNIQQTARKALLGFTTRWHLRPSVLNDLHQQIDQRAADRLRERGLLPWEERHDALVLAEAGVLDCALLLTDDSHLRDLDFLRMSILFRELDVTAPVLATPAEVARRFYD
jgi:rRNA-processing protein FCF1